MGGEELIDFFPLKSRILMKIIFFEENSSDSSSVLKGGRVHNNAM